MSKACQVQYGVHDLLAASLCPTVGLACGKRAVALWDWGGPTLYMCRGHDSLMRLHVDGCRDCRERLKRSEK